jgi:hypothetical protein
MQLKAARRSPPEYLPGISRWRIAAMDWIIAFLSRLLGNEWREIASAPFDREIEVAIIDEEIGVLSSSCLRHGNGWLDAETLRPIELTATHWRYRWPVTLPVSCC